MKFYFPVFFVLLFLTVACNNQPAATQATTADPHAGHNMAAITTDSVAARRAAENDPMYARRGYADSVNQGIITADTFKGSPVRETSGTIGSTKVHIRYGSPGVRGRVIWGGLVANDQVWASGAHKATAVTFDKEVTIGGTIVPAGKYALFTIPNAQEWTVILNKNWDQHLADEYAEADDVVRTKVKPAMLDRPVQRLTYTVENVSPTRGNIVLTWEKRKVALPVQVQ
jgi:hypothetical protein